MIRCPYCGKLNNMNRYTSNTQDGRVRRRRECFSCNRRFTTYEVILETIEEKGDTAFMRARRGKKSENRS